MKRQGTSMFVAELVTNWLKEIKSPAVLDDFEKLIKERRAMLMIETDKERDDKLVSNLKNCKQGDTLFLMNPLPASEWQNTKGKDYSLKENRMQCTFWQWMPRKKRLWVIVPWKTKRVHHGKNFILMAVRDIKKFQPSRTEASIRIEMQNR